MNKVASTPKNITNKMDDQGHFECIYMTSSSHSSSLFSNKH